ncbi:5-formyltetrahydrofolate cyclo-ligase [Gillisia mitskevichiae]|uniref:5-formyltetrahydrofolate cyclo-ligase n=1 Tax=Gillisia mitskevichiae TaxID=270921 RepID=A0A495PZ73_9FLAO|nr:5-formyltetrahydrofolate cyclo-ligase [Gillisia mitskevichiae]RKS55500.1 5-formyltetrahydrofolate cyclo-ligase [Gillisia mitskevichiae]
MKNKLRKIYVSKRDELTPDQIEEFSLEIANKLLQLPIWDLEYYHLFLSITEKKEVETEFILHILQGKDKNIVLSKSDFDTRKLHNFLLTDSSVIRKNKWNIPEPVDGIEIPSEKIDVVFVPLLAFDLNGHRLGYGKGFYDIFLASCKPGVIKVGVSFFEAEKMIPELETSDIALDFCVTPHKTYVF